MGYPASLAARPERDQAVEISEQSRTQKTMRQIRRRPALLVLALSALALLAAACGGGGPDFTDPELQEFDDQFTTAGQPHLQPGQPAPGISTPPYGGPHGSQPLRCGIYEAEQPFEPIIHTMEHGAVAIYYQPLVLTGDDVAEIRVVAAAMLREGARLIMTPSTQLARPIIVASWGRLMAMTDFSEERLRGFVDAFEGDGPEDIGC